MAVKMNLRIITKNFAANPEIGLLAKSISKSNGCTTAMPTAWEFTETVMLKYIKGKLGHSRLNV